METDSRKLLSRWGAAGSRFAERCAADTAPHRSSRPPLTTVHSRLARWCQRGAGCGAAALQVRCHPIQPAKASTEVRRAPRTSYTETTSAVSPDSSAVPVPLEPHHPARDLSHTSPQLPPAAPPCLPLTLPSTAFVDPSACEPVTAAGHSTRWSSGQKWTTGSGICGDWKRLVARGLNSRQPPVSLSFLHMRVVVLHISAWWS